MPATSPLKVSAVLVKLFGPVQLKVLPPLPPITLTPMLPSLLPSQLVLKPPANWLSVTFAANALSGSVSVMLVVKLHWFVSVTTRS